MSWHQHWQPGQRQHKQHGVTRRKSRAYYVRNRSKILSRQRRRRSQSSWKNNPARKRSEARRKHLNRHRVANKDFAPPYQRGGENGKPQHVQLPSKKREDARAYKSDTKRKRDSAAYYHLVCKRDPNCMRRRKEYRDHPEKYKRKKAPSRKGSVLTKPNITFTLGDNEGVVDQISPFTGMVTFRLFSTSTMPLASLPARVFMAAVTFLTEEDTQSFLELVETELGLEVYDDLTWPEIRSCQGLFRIVPEALVDCIELLGDTTIENNPEPAIDALVATYGVLEGGGNRYLPYMFYGGIEDKEMATPERLEQIKKELITKFLNSSPSISLLESEGDRLIHVFKLLKQSAPEILLSEVDAARKAEATPKGHSATPKWKALQAALKNILEMDQHVKANLQRKGRLNRILAEEGFFAKRANPFSNWGLYTPKDSDEEKEVEEAEALLNFKLAFVEKSQEVKTAIKNLRSLAGPELIMSYPEIVRSVRSVINARLRIIVKMYSHLGAGDGETSALFRAKVENYIFEGAEVPSRLRTFLIGKL